MNRSQRTSILLVAGLAILLAPPCGWATGDLAALLRTGDAEDGRLETAAAIASFSEAEKLAPEDPAVLLRLSKEYSDLMSEKSGDAAKQLGEKSLDYARRAAQLDPGNAKAHLCLAIAYGKLTDFTDNRTRVEYSKLIRDEAEESLRLDPGDDFAHHVLGRWNEGVATLSPMMRVLARIAYGGLPEASLDEAAKELRKASELAPQRILHHAALAHVLTEQGKTAEARKEWQVVLDLPGVDKDDAVAKQAAREALK